MKTLVLYRSKSGFVKKYAEWLAEALGGDLREAGDVTMDMLETYDTVIYGGGLYAVGINGIKDFKKHLAQLAGKTVIVYACGASPGREEIYKEILDANFTEEERELIGFFYMRGGFDFSRLSSVDKILMRMMKWHIKRKKPEERTPDERGMLAAYDTPVDFTNEREIQPIIDYIRDNKGGQ